MTDVVGTNYLIGLVLACIAIILLPGPSVMFVIARAVAWGPWTAWLTALGNALGMFVLAAVIAIGLGPLFQRWHALLLITQVLGGMYLIYLGWQALKHRHEHVAELMAVEEVRPPPLRIMREGFMVGVLNTKATIFFAAIFPQFVDPQGGTITLQLLLFGFIFSVLCVLLDGTWGLLVGHTRHRLANSEGRLLALRVIGGIVMVLLGITAFIPVIDELVFPA